MTSARSTCDGAYSAAATSHTHMHTLMHMTYTHTHHTLQVVRRALDKRRPLEEAAHARQCAAALEARRRALDAAQQDERCALQQTLWLH
jgi:hypothetical protein